MRQTALVSGSSLLHLMPLADYNSEEPLIRPSSLDSQGFAHCSPDAATTMAVANLLYREADGPVVAVELDPDALSAPVRWEAADPAPPPGVPDGTLFPHVYGPIEKSAVTEVHHARRDVDGTFLALEPRPRTAEELDLLPHPEGGWYRQTWRGSATVHPGTPQERPSATAIYFLLPPGQSSAWHVVASDELWFWHRGGPLTLSLGGRGETPSETGSIVLGAGPGEAGQGLVPAGTWQRADASATSETLVSCVVSPGFDFADFRTA
jgi:predicted cupin superfamily sugar epimerase/uncharacterized protein (DUF952 family)